MIRAGLLDERIPGEHHFAMPILAPYVNCPTCYSRVVQDQYDMHMQWHANLQAAMKGAYPLISVSLLNGL